MLLREFVRLDPTLEAVAVRGRHHLEVFVAAPAGQDVVRKWVMLLYRLRPEVLDDQLRHLHYHLAGVAAVAHLHRVGTGRYAADSEAGPARVRQGMLAALATAAQCGTLGAVLEHVVMAAISAPPSIGDGPDRQERSHQPGSNVRQQSTIRQSN